MEKPGLDLRIVKKISLTMRSDKKSSLIELKMKANEIENTTFKVTDAFSSYAITDGNLITGQQQNSGAAAAKMVVDQLSKN